MINFCEDISLMLAKAAKPTRDQAGNNSSNRSTDGEGHHHTDRQWTDLGCHGRESDDQTTDEELQKGPIRKY